MRHKKVLIVEPSLVFPLNPALGPAVLVAGCRQRNIHCSIYYANLTFAGLVGIDLYRKVACSSRLLISDALFAPYVFNLEKNALINSYFKEDSSLKVLGGNIYESLLLEEYLQCDQLVPAFIDYTVNKILSEKPTILGFTSVFEQIVISLGIAKQIKKVMPEVITVMGGTNVTSPMGEALLEIAPMIDYCFSGSADVEFPLFCQDYFEKGALPSNRTIHCDPIDNFEHVAVPNYEDYFQQLRELQSTGSVPDYLPQSIPFESSRGCWWGEKCHCAFCGFNTNHMKYRQKPKERIIQEIIHLKNKYGVKVLLATDNIMPHNFDEVIQDVINLDEKIIFFYEVRSNLQPAFLDDLVRAGVVLLQVGVESLSTPVLQKMRKGINGLQNIKLLRNTRSRWIYVAWNFLLWIPGETAEDYREIVKILPTLEHLQSPYFWGPVTIDRHSPYFNHPQEFGIMNVQPCEEYTWIYPPGTNLAALAYHFWGEYESCFSTNQELFEELNRKIGNWFEQWHDPLQPPQLSRISITNGMALINDTRRVAAQTYTMLDDRTTALLEMLAEPQRYENIPEEWRDYLGELLERKFVVFFEGHYISLVTDSLLESYLRPKTGAVGSQAPALSWNKGILRHLSGEGTLSGAGD